MLKHSKKEIKQALEVIAEPANHPVLFHCEFGKDRTGVIAALVLFCAGVSEEDICNDYSTSNVYTRGYRQIMS